MSWFVKTFFLTACAFAWLPAPSVARTVAHKPPPLTVVVVVDQLRGDELSRYSHVWKHGLKTFTHQALWFSQAAHGHARAETAAGHATIGTGLHPKYHAVVSKSFYDADTHKTMAVCGMGPTPCEPLASYEPSLGDRLKQLNPLSKVVSVSQKDRAAVLPAGRHPDLVAWFAEDGTAHMVGRTQGEPGVPSWLEEAYQARTQEHHIRAPWVLPAHMPKSLANRKDNLPGEADCGHGLVFPHTIPPSLQGKALFRAWRCTPANNELVKDLALLTVDRMDLGKDAHPDMLWVSFSAVDVIGHYYGAESLERAAALWELDRQLGELLKGLQQRVPHVVVALTADHGVTFMPETWHAKGIQEPRRVSEAEVESFLLEGLQQTCTAQNPQEPPLAALVSPFVTLNPSYICKAGQNIEQYAAEVASVLQKHPAVYKAWTYDSLNQDKDPVALLMRENWHPKRSGHVAFVLKKNFTAADADHKEVGANHGMPWWDDLHVPVALWGKGIRAAQVKRPVKVIDLMRTVSDLVGLPVDNRSGQPLL
jgi:hypothetical protein